jgi:hypothetical protein
MMDSLRRLYRGSAVGRFVLGLPRWLYQAWFRFRFYVRSDESAIKWKFEQVMGYVPDLQNPKTLNEKMQWLKLHDRTPLHTQCADKYAVRPYVADKIGAEYLVPLLFHTTDIADLVPENLPDAPFIVKTTHASSGGTIVRDKATADWEALRDTLREQLRADYYFTSKEWQYKNIEPAIVVEALLQDRAGDIPFDYKIHAFNGEPSIIQVDLDRFTNHRRNLYDLEWRLQPFTWCDWEDGKPLWPNGRDVPAPAQLQLMLDLTKTLSSDFLYTRVDLYVLNDDQIFFGEITFHHGSGREIFTPAEWDRSLGDRLRLPHEEDATV